MLRLILFYLISALLYGRDAQATDLCRTIDYISLYDRLDSVGISVSSLAVEPLSAHIRASSLAGDIGLAWPEVAAVILFDELPLSVRTIKIDDQTKATAYGARIYTADAFRDPGMDFSSAGISSFLEISIANGTLQVISDNMPEDRYPDLMVQLAEILGKNQAIKSLKLVMDSRLIMEPDFLKWQRIAGQTDLPFLQGEGFFYSSLETTGKHLKIKIHQRNAEAERDIQLHPCWGSGDNLHRFSSFVTVTVP